MTYIPGDYWMIDERTGIKFRRSEMVLEPVLDQEGGIWVNRSSMDPPHPQDFVTSVDDDPSVYPTSPNVEQVMGESQLESTMPKFGTNILLASITGLSVNDPIGITLNDSTIFWSFITDVTVQGVPLIDVDGVFVRDVNGEVVITADVGDGYLMTIYSQIFEPADYGNVVYLPSLNDEVWI